MKYLTIDDVCEMLSISRRTLERMRSETLVVDERNVEFTLRTHPLRAFGRVAFPEPDLFIGRSPRWEQERLITWLENYGHLL
ncbi:hypothetical protein BG259_05790 [Vibrio harveyi]|nr:hypothetical protein BG259_05790 [Vibrio harveyi]USD53598.1 helix-turn-helix domain-containing protein [Vibrio sp. SCSIO 43155]